MARRKILIVDDEVASGGLEEMLTKLGYDVDLIPATEGKADAARALQQLEDSFFETSIDMLCCLDFNMHFRRLSPAWERTLGFTREELLSRPFIEFVHPDDRERTLAQNAEVRSGEKALSFENRYLCKDGSYRWLRWNAAPHSTEKVIYSVARDITENKRADEEREKLVRELQTALAEVKSLREILPICSYCRKIRDDENYWHTVENYISEHTETRFSHSICPSCMATHHEPQLEKAEVK
jgi:PAS domain S-box-containing protein